MNSRGVVVAVTLATGSALLAGPASPAAEPTRVMSVGFNFLPPETEIARGTAVELVNLDPAPHNVTSLVTGTNGSPLFWSDTVDVAGQAMVKGIEGLPPGVYDYVCSVHPAMLGSFVITG